MMAGSAAPQNDDIINAIPLRSSRISQSTVNAANSPGEDTTVGPQNVPSGKTLWYTYTAQRDWPVSISTRNSDFDTTLQTFVLTNIAAAPSYNNLTEVGYYDAPGYGGTDANPEFF
jgi:hypothetical protein